MAPAQRELEILSFLEKLSRTRTDSVVVGGYAVSALVRNRFSADCDLVLAEKDVNGIIGLLESQGFTKAQDKAGLGGTPPGRFLRFVKKLDGLPVSVDLTVGSLVCPDTGGSWSFDYLRSHTLVVSIPGVEHSVSFRVPERELLLALKVHPARLVDVRDAVMLSRGARWEDVAAHLNRGDTGRLLNSLKRVLRDLEDPALADSLTSEFAIRQDAAVGIRKARDHLKPIVAKLEEEFGTRV